MVDGAQSFDRHVVNRWRLRFDLAGTAVEVDTADPAWSRHIERRYGAFVTAAAPDVRIIHDPAATPAPVSYGAEGVVLGGAATGEHLDALLTTLLPERLAPALLVHGTLLTDGRVTYLCCGVSGAGKSTLAALLPERALCDELTVVRPAGGGFEAVALPFWRSRPGSGPLAAILVLEHAPEHRRTALAPAEAARELRRHICWPTDDPASLERCFSTLAGVAARVPVARLGFRPDPSVWKVIAGIGGAG